MKVFLANLIRWVVLKEQLLLFVTTARHTVIFLNLMEENSELCKKY